MTEKPLVSIITPSYNQGRFIEETILSVLNQGYPNIEYIVIDGKSTDNTLDVLRKYEDKITWISEQDKGQSDAINKGWRMAKGEILAWLNSDDTYLPGAISKVVEFSLKNPDKCLLYGKGYWIDVNGNTIGKSQTIDYDRELLKQFFYIFQPAMFIKSEVIKKVGMLNANLHYSMDYELVIRISQEYDFGYLPDYLANFRKHQGAKTSAEAVKAYQDTLMVQLQHYQHVSYYYVYSYLKSWIRSKTKLPNMWVKIFAYIISFFKFIQLNKQLPSIRDFVGTYYAKFLPGKFQP